MAGVTTIMNAKLEASRMQLTARSGDALIAPRLAVNCTRASSYLLPKDFAAWKKAKLKLDAGGYGRVHRSSG
jgi:hypothetical protein